MITNVITVAPDTTYAEAARIMRERRFSGLPVLEGGRLVGIVSDKDLFRALYPEFKDFVQDPELWLDQEAQESEIDSVRGSAVVKYMTRKVLTIEPEAPVMRAGGLMLARNIHRLPVLQQGRLVGIVTRREIYGAILEKSLRSDGLRQDGTPRRDAVKAV